MNKFWLIAILLGISSIFIFADYETPSYYKNQSVADLLFELGDTALVSHRVRSGQDNVSAKIGESIVKKGFVQYKSGKTTKIQSKHFVCTSCHNVSKEDPDLSISDPEARLDYTAQHGIPFLQGTSLYGAINREFFYNDDYYKKYGDLVVDARKDIRNAIQLCATECAQGRPLRSWEMESIMSYLWTIDLQMNDLNISDVEYVFIEEAINNNADKLEAIQLIKSKYLQASPAHFIDPPENRKTGIPNTAEPDKGQLIYENSCLHCHEKRKYSYFNLDNSKLTFKYLQNKIGTYTPKSIYQVIRYGVPTYSGKQSYMPHYPEEKMSRKQMDDLRAYIDLMAD